MREAEFGNIVPIKAITQNICKELVVSEKAFLIKICLKPNKIMTMKNCQKIIPKCPKPGLTEITLNGRVRPQPQPSKINTKYGQIEGISAKLIEGSRPPAAFQ